MIYKKREYRKATWREIRAHFVMIYGGVTDYLKRLGAEARGSTEPAHPGVELAGIADADT